jgi:hypothetical protein
VFERDIFFRFDSVGARIRKSSGPKEPTWGTDLDDTKHSSQANNFTRLYFFRAITLKKKKKKKKVTYFCGTSDGCFLLEWDASSRFGRAKGSECTS